MAKLFVPGEIGKSSHRSFRVLLQAMGHGVSLEVLQTGRGGCRVNVVTQGLLCRANIPDAER